MKQKVTTKENLDQRKSDHIQLAFKSQIESAKIDSRFYYEPLFGHHQLDQVLIGTDFLDFELNAPLWVSSMTGGTEKARHINQNLAKACRDFGIGMGLGSCRPILYSKNRFDDFNLRHIIGSNVPFFANLGIAQLEEIIDNNNFDILHNLISKLYADGLIIHVNPIQEWLQSEGDRFKRPPIYTIETIIQHLEYPVIVKEVGQGFGPKSLQRLLEMPIYAIEFAAAGGTNFSKLELLRKQEKSDFENMSYIGANAEQMLIWTNDFVTKFPDRVKCEKIIISGGISNFLDGYHLVENSKISAIYGQASSMLANAQGDYVQLYNYIRDQIEGYKFATSFLEPKPINKIVNK